MIHLNLDHTINDMPLLHGGCAEAGTLWWEFGSSGHEALWVGPQ